MELEKIGNLSLDPNKVREIFPSLRPGISAAVSDISIYNYLNAIPYVASWTNAKPGERADKGRSQTIFGIEQLLKA